MRSWLAAIILVGLFLHGTASADIYSWVDDGGVQHYTAEPGSIPEVYRSKAQRLSLPDAPPAPPELKPISPPKGPIKIAFSPGSPILVSARINEVGPITLILDTGADRTMIMPSVMARAGLSTENASPGILSGVTGTAYAQRTWVNSIEVGGVKVGPLLIVVYESSLPNADGLLGRDFLASFSVTIDPKQGLVTLMPN
jgi:hypothetical protein